MHKTLLTLLLFSWLSLWVFPSSASAADVLKKPAFCLVCEKVHTSAAHTVDYKGHRIPLCSAECVGEFEKHRAEGTLDPITKKIEPRAALFQEDSNPKAVLSGVYFAVGFLVLLGLICGGLASYLAVQKGIPGGRAFALGLAFNVIGLAYVWSRPARAMAFTSAGLTKIPSTREGDPCPQCGRANHPSAQSCIACRSPLKPAAPSEVRIVGLRSEP